MNLIKKKLANKNYLKKLNEIAMIGSYPSLFRLDALHECPKYTYSSVFTWHLVLFIVVLHFISFVIYHMSLQASNVGLHSINYI